jgi:predicted nucleic acid-binding protein
MISVLTRVELEGGVYRDGEAAPLIRRRLDLILGQFDELPFTAEEARAYGRIVEHCGYSRARTIDRMIAATVIVAGAILITLDAADFRAVPGLEIDDWSAAAR